MMAISIMHVKSNIENLLFPSMNTAVNILIAAALSKKIKKMQPVQVQLRVHCVCPHSVFREAAGKFIFLSFLRLPLHRSHDGRLLFPI